MLTCIWRLNKFCVLSFFLKIFYFFLLFSVNLGDKKKSFFVPSFLVFKKVLLVPSAQWTGWIRVSGMKGFSVAAGTTYGTDNRLANSFRGSTFRSL